MGPFLDPEAINISSLGAIWNFRNRAVLSWYQIMGHHKRPVYKA